MPKTKKAPAQKNVEVLPPEPEETPKKPILAKQSHRIVTTYQKEIPAPVIEDEPEETLEAEDESDQDESDYEIDESAVEVEPADPIAALLEEIGANTANYSMIVSRLKNYERDQRTDIKSRTYCGALTIPDAEYLQEERYKEDIQLKWARANQANYFLCQIRRNGRASVFLPNVVAVEPLTPRELAEKAPDVAQNPTFMPSAAPAESGNDLTSFFRTAKQLQGLGLLPNFAEMQKTPPPPPAEISDELALLRLVNADTETRSKLFEGLRSLMNGGQKETSWVDLIATALEHGPALIEAAGRIWAQSASAPNVLMPGVPAPVAVAAPATPPPPPTVEEQLFTFVLSSLERRAPVTGVAAMIGRQADLNPQLEPVIEGFLAMSPQDCLNWLAGSSAQAKAIADTPYAADWIESLQRELMREDVENETTQPTIM